MSNQVCLIFATMISIRLTELLLGGTLRLIFNQRWLLGSPRDQTPSHKALSSSQYSSPRIQASITVAKVDSGQATTNCKNLKVPRHGSLRGGKLADPIKRNRIQEENQWQSRRAMYRLTPSLSYCSRGHSKLHNKRTTKRLQNLKVHVRLYTPKGANACSM